MSPVGIAVVGCGNISHEYLQNLISFADVRVLVCADIEIDRAKEAAERYGVPDAGDFDLALAHPDVELVVNLTIPAAHVEVSAAAVAAGKHVYSEKPLALDPAGGTRLLADAAAAGVRVGAAPDTFLGAGVQTALRLIAEGAIGIPQSVLALLQSPGPQSWHPNPEFFFQNGAGPLFDMGPYHLTALAAVFGSVRRVAASTRKAFSERVIGTGPRAGARLPVEVSTHVTALLEYAGGPVATTVFSFDSPLSRQDFFEITGTEATLAVPNPNNFGGQPRLRSVGDRDWTVVPDTGPAVGRGVGVLDMARAIRSGDPHRATGLGALHVVEVMTAAMESAARGEFVSIESTFPVPEPLPADWDPYTRTL